MGLSRLVKKQQSLMRGGTVFASSPKWAAQRDWS